MIVEVSKRAQRWRRWQRPLLAGLAGVGVLAGVVLLVWRVPPAISTISSRRYADAVEIGIRVILVVIAVVLVGAVLDRARRRWWLWATATLGMLVGLTAVVLLVWLAPPALYKNIAPAKDRASAEATTRTGLIAGLAGLAALGGLAMTARTYRLTEQGQITDRYTKAIEQLGDNKLDIRLGGIYALERIARDSKRDHPTVVEVLRTFVSEHSHPRSGRAHRRLSPSTERIATDVQAAINVLLRLPGHPGLPQVQLNYAHFPHAQLLGADLAGARLDRADLTHAWLLGATLAGAQLDGATLTGAILGRADLTHAWLGGATLAGAILGRTNLAGARLDRANLSDAWLGGATLTTVKNLTQQQLNSAQGNETTLLPAGLQWPTHWFATD